MSMRQPTAINNSLQTEATKDVRGRKKGSYSPMTITQLTNLNRKYVQRVIQGRF